MNDSGINYTAETIFYTVTYDANGAVGTPPGSGTSQEGSPVVVIGEGTLQMEGFNFCYWNTESDGTGVDYVTGEIFIIERDTTLYAQWERLLFTVTHDANSGRGGKDVNIQFGLDYTILSQEEAEISNDGHIFTGWNTKPDGSGNNYTLDAATRTFNPSTIIIAAQNMVLYAQWRKILDTADDVVATRETAEEVVPTPELGVSVVPPPAPPGYELVPQDDGSYEVIDENNAPLGVVRKNENDEWILLSLGGLLALVGIYLFALNHRRVTRGEFVRMVVGVIRPEAANEKTVAYTDVAEGAKHYHTIMNAKSVGFLIGFLECEFQPNIPITREEMASILAETTRYKNPGISANHLDLSTVFRDWAGWTTNAKR